MNFLVKRAPTLVSNKKIQGLKSSQWLCGLHLISNDQEKLLITRKREYNVSRRQDSTLIIGGLGLTAAAVSIQYGMKAYQEYKASRPQQEEKNVNSESETKSKEAQANSSANKEKLEGFFGSFFSTTFYDGGFEDKMTRREAALILGLRESASVDRIKEAHRKMLINNHPDRGGSAFIAAKINEAKDLLLKGKTQ